MVCSFKARLGLIAWRKARGRITEFYPSCARFREGETYGALAYRSLGREHLISWGEEECPILYANRLR